MASKTPRNKTYTDKTISNMDKISEIEDELVANTAKEGISFARHVMKKRERYEDRVEDLSPRLLYRLLKATNWCHKYIQELVLSLSTFNQLLLLQRFTDKERESILEGCEEQKKQQIIADLAELKKIEDPEQDQTTPVTSRDDPVRSNSLQDDDVLAAKTANARQPGKSQARTKSVSSEVIRKEGNKGDKGRRGKSSSDSSNESSKDTNYGSHKQSREGSHDDSIDESSTDDSSTEESSSDEKGTKDNQENRKNRREKSRVDRIVKNSTDESSTDESSSDEKSTKDNQENRKNRREKSRVDRIVKNSTDESSTDESSSDEKSTKDNQENRKNRREKSRVDRIVKNSTDESSTEESSTDESGNEREDQPQQLLPQCRG